MRPQAAFRQEELEPSEARRPAKEGILKLTAEWRERMARARQAQDAATAAGRAEPAVDAEEPPTGTQADADPAAVEALTAGRDRLQAELHTLREENGRLRSSNEELRAESGRRDDEAGKLNELVVRGRRTELAHRQPRFGWQAPESPRPQCGAGAPFRTPHEKLRAAAHIFPRRIRPDGARRVALAAHTSVSTLGNRTASSSTPVTTANAPSRTTSSAHEHLWSISEHLATGVRDARPARAAAPPAAR